MLYVDGSLKTTGTNSLPIITTINRFTAGALDRSTLSSLFNGSIDDVRLYGKALSASEVSEIFQGLIYTHLAVQNVALQSLNLNVYPNPLSDGNLTLTIGCETTNAEVMIFDMSGKLIYKNTFSGMSSEIPGDSFENGVYIISVQTYLGNDRKIFVKQ